MDPVSDTLFSENCNFQELSNTNFNVPSLETSVIKYILC
jgi:hypothetical protein